jgi:hypothetical protein
MGEKLNILYCHCKYARVVEKDVKDTVLDGLSASGVAFHAAPDLCEMASRKDALMDQRAKAGNLHIIACYPRAIKALYKQAGFDFSDDITIHNMREETPDQILEKLNINQTASSGSTNE